MIASKPIPANIIAAEAFSAKTVEAANGCLLWVGSVNEQGYGRVRFVDGDFQAHRVALALCGVELPAGMVVDHLCRNRRCVNPEHLDVVTPRINNLRGEGATGAYLRANESGRCVNGHLLAEVGFHRARGRMTCAQCGRDRVARYKGRKAGAS